MTPPCFLHPPLCRFLSICVELELHVPHLNTHFSFIAFCHFLSIIGMKYSTLYFAFCKACARRFPSTPFTKCALTYHFMAFVRYLPCMARAHLYSTRLRVRPAELSPTGFRHRPQGRFKPSGTICPSVVIPYHTQAIGQWWLRHFFASKKASH